MRINKDIIIQFFRYLWIALALAIIIFIISNGFYTKRSLEYKIDFSQSISQNIRGWYPEQRLSNVSVSSLSNAYDIIAEPVYMKIYTPIDFDEMIIQGAVYSYNLEDIKLGLKQEDGSWFYKKIDAKDFSLNFNLTNARIKNNQLEIILSIPDMVTPARLSLVNNWKVILSR